MNKIIKKRPRQHISFQTLSSGDETPPWLTIFSDLLSLLLAFFVLIYITYSPDFKKWKALASAFNMTFSLENFGGYSINEEAQEKLDLIFNFNTVQYGYLEKILQLKISELPSLLQYNRKITQEGILITLLNHKLIKFSTDKKIIKDLEKFAEIFNSMGNANISISIGINTTDPKENFAKLHNFSNLVIKVFQQNGYKNTIEIIYKFNDHIEDYIGILVH